MYRVRDAKNNCWVIDNVFLSPLPEDILYVVKRGIFGRIKLEIAPDYYFYQRYIELIDKNLVPVFEGDIIKAQIKEDKFVIGVVTYAEEYSSYIMLCNETSQFFSLGTEINEHIEVIGNVFDDEYLLSEGINEHEEEQHGQQTLQEEEV